ncbi:Matrix-remodeling-associated protein 8, partial [Dryobates pubescens]
LLLWPLPFCLLVLPCCWLSVPADASNPASVVVSVLNISAALGSQAVLPCKSHRMVWTQDRLNDRQRVVHWDVLSTYYGDNKMERLCDMYSAGEQRVYSSYNQGRILMPQNAFTDGNFSLVIKGVAESDEGIYSCNLHHHYCHLYETVKIQLSVTKKVLQELSSLSQGLCSVRRSSFSWAPCGQRRLSWAGSTAHRNVLSRQFQPPAMGRDTSHQPSLLKASSNLPLNSSREGTSTASLGSLWFSGGVLSDEGGQECRASLGNLCQCLPTLTAKNFFLISSLNLPSPSFNPNVVRGHNVINVIIPESRMHFFQQLGYVLATLLLFIILLIVVVLISRKRRHRGYEYNVKKYGEKDVNLKEFTVDTTDLTQHKSEDLRLDYKNNILKEKAEQARSFPAKNIDLDKDFRKEYCK